MSSSAGFFAHTLQQIGLKTLRTPTSTLTLAETSLKAKAIRARDKALKEAEALTDPKEHRQALAAVAGVSASNGGITLIRRV